MLANNVASVLQEALVYEMSMIKTTRLASLLLLYKEESSARIIGERAACKDDHIFIAINLPVSVNHMTDD